MSTFYNFSDAWINLLDRLIQHGQPVSPRDQGTRELLAQSFTVTALRENILIHPVRDLSYRFMVAEWLWIAAGRDDVHSIGKFSRIIQRFSDDGETFFGAYGPHIVRQWPYLLDKLRSSPDTRQAVASIWRPSPPATKDVPCTLTWQLLLRGEYLHTIVNMRSSDIWLGLPYDFFNFSQLTNLMAAYLKVCTGSLTFNLGSSHLYDRDRGKATEVIWRRSLTEHAASPPLPVTSTMSHAGFILDRSVDHLDHRAVRLMTVDEQAYVIGTPWETYLNLLCGPREDALRRLKELQP